VNAATAAGAAAKPASPYLAAQPDAAARLRMFCFHHAGGGASIFADWQKALGPGVSVVPVQLPGRERRIRDPRITDMAQLVAELDEHLGPHMDAPYVLYGHSMGGLVAWNLVRLRAERGRRLPEALLIGAANPPHLPPVSTTLRGLSRDRLIQWLLDTGGMSPMVLKYPDWVEAAASLVRDDFDLCNSHRHAEERGGAPLPVPIHGFAGRSDSVVGAETVRGWLEHSERPGTLYTVPGGHLFIRESADRFLNLLSGLLARIGSEAREGGHHP
jgi:surfactin synthase thioesterase subunit